MMTLPFHKKEKTSQEIKQKKRMQSLFCGTDSTEEVDAHALITTLYSEPRKTKSEEGKGTKKQTRICTFGQ